MAFRCFPVTIGRHNLNGHINLAPLQNLATSSALAGYSICTFVVINGMPIDTEASSAVTGTVTLAPAKIVCTMGYNVKVRQLDAAPRKFRGTNNIATTGITNAFCQNPDGLGVADPVANAINQLVCFS